MAWVTQRRYDIEGMDIWVARSFHQRYHMARRFCTDNVIVDENYHIEWRSELCLVVETIGGRIHEVWRIVYIDTGSAIPINGIRMPVSLEQLDGEGQ